MRRRIAQILHSLHVTAPAHGPALPLPGAAGADDCARFGKRAMRVRLHWRHVCYSLTQRSCVRSTQREGDMSASGQNGVHTKEHAVVPYVASLSEGT